MEPVVVSIDGYSLYFHFAYGCIHFIIGSQLEQLYNDEEYQLIHRVTVQAVLVFLSSLYTLSQNELFYCVTPYLTEN